MAVNIDVKAFHDALYGAFLEVGVRDVDVSTALICIRLLMHERREVSLDRVAAFCRRLVMLGLRSDNFPFVVSLSLNGNLDLNLTKQ